MLPSFPTRRSSDLGRVENGIGNIGPGSPAKLALLMKVVLFIHVNKLTAVEIAVDTDYFIIPVLPAEMTGVEHSVAGYSKIDKLFAQLILLNGKFYRTVCGVLIDIEQPFMYGTLLNG